jgi:hypothetical protein
LCRPEYEQARHGHLLWLFLVEVAIDTRRGVVRSVLDVLLLVGPLPLPPPSRLIRRIILVVRLAAAAAAVSVSAAAATTIAAAAVMRFVLPHRHVRRPG